jgi:type IV pilus assembly protein PilW
MNRRAHRGLTLIELMVALVLALVVILAAASALLTARRGFATVDAVGQLQDNARFAVEMVHRIAAQSGYLDDAQAVQTRPSAFPLTGAAPSPAAVQGYDDALAPAGAIGTNGSRATGCTGAAGKACRQGGDVLVLRTQAAARAPGATESDHAIVDCMGDTVKTAPTRRDDLSVSVLYVAVGGDGEPSLMCSAGTTDKMSTSTQPIVQGVESFQVLYGVDGVVPNAKTPSTAAADGVAERYLRADQMVVAGDDAATQGNWRRVRSLRIGMVLRSAPGATQDRAFTPLLHPLGEAMSSASDPGSRFVPEDDGRLRRTMTFTVHLHNAPASS